MNAAIEERYAFAKTVTVEAGKLALSYFDTGVTVETKSDESPVTIADRSAEAHLRDAIRHRYPSDGLLGEEYGDEPGISGYRWIIDPIDGTRSFIRNIPIWATLVALEFEGKPVAGLAYIPAWNMMYHAMRGAGAFRDTRPIHVSDAPTLEKSVVSYSGFGFFKSPESRQKFTTLLQRTERSRSYADFYGFVLVAQGSVDLMVDFGVHIWDIAPLQVIVEEAGGKFGDWTGGQDLLRPDVVCSNGHVHDEALSILRD